MSENITIAAWKVHTSSLLNEILSNPGTEILHRPIQILGHLLHQVGERAAELNDPLMNELMCRLTLYSAADPESPDFSPEVLRIVNEQANLHRTNKIAY